MNGAVTVVIAVIVANVVNAVNVAVKFAEVIDHHRMVEAGVQLEMKQQLLRAIKKSNAVKNLQLKVNQKLNNQILNKKKIKISFCFFFFIADPRDEGWQDVRRK